MPATTTPETELTPELLDRIRKLSPESRARLRALLGEEPVPPPAPLPPVFESNEALWAEIARRVQAVERGEMKTYTAAEAMALIRKARMEREAREEGAS